MGIRVYFAHHQVDYDTDRAARAMDMIRAMFGIGLEAIVDPSLMDEADIDFYRAEVGECDAVAFLANEDGTVGPGTFAEALEAHVKGKPVYAISLTHDIVVLRRYLMDHVQTIEEARVAIREAKGEPTADHLSVVPGSYGVSNVMGSREAMAEEALAMTEPNERADTAWNAMQAAIENDDEAAVECDFDTGQPVTTQVNDASDKGAPLSYHDKIDLTQPVVSD